MEFKCTYSSDSKFSAKQNKARIYVWPKGESVLENLQNRRSRPIRTYRQALLPALAIETGIPMKELDPSLKWSQKAGCKCGCSPGFILNHYGLRKDLHFYIEQV